MVLCSSAWAICEKIELMSLPEYRMPAEWESRTKGHMVAWPHNHEDWPGKFGAIPWVYAEIVRLLAEHERVHLLVQDAAAEKRVAGILKRAGANLSQVDFSTVADQSRMAARHWTDFCEGPSG